MGRSSREPHRSHQTGLNTNSRHLVAVRCRSSSSALQDALAPSIVSDQALQLLRLQLATALTGVTETTRMIERSILNDCDVIGVDTTAKGIYATRSGVDNRNSPDSSSCPLDRNCR